MQPLAEILRPTSLDDYIGQSHLVGPGAPLRLAIEKGKINSLIFWGPPGSGKTTLARIIASSLKQDFYYLSAVSAKKDDIRRILGIRPRGENQPVLFLDEIHRFSKAQQDYLLPYVESGALTLIGATTENPSFEVISPLLSRCHIYVLQPLGDDDLRTIISRTLQHYHHLPAQAGSNNGSDSRSRIDIAEEAVDFLVAYGNGDARKVINTLESTISLFGDKKVKITKEHLLNTLQTRALRYDRQGEEHYDTISAFIKSMRASQPDAALYYLARMVEAGEDPLFIARRMVIFASEDIGVAVPTALVVANAVFRACETIGYPECQLNLAEGVVYLSTCRKSRAVNDAYFAALEDVRKFGNLEIPLKIRNAPTKLMKNLGYGKDYKQYDKENFLPEKIKNKKYYE